jgi:hypothetical protein
LRIGIVVPGVTPRQEPSTLGVAPTPSRLCQQDDDAKPRRQPARAA